MLHDVSISVEQCIYPVDFVVLEMEDQSEVLILGRPFLATAGAIIDVRGAKLQLDAGDEGMVFDMRIPKQKCID